MTDGSLQQAQHEEAFSESRRNLYGMLGGLAGLGFLVMAFAVLQSGLAVGWLVVVGLPLLAAAVTWAVLAVVAQSRMTDAVERMWRITCAQSGWSYEPRDFGLPAAYEGFRPFGVGHDQHADHIVRGTMEGVEFTAFTYVYQVTSGSGKSRHTTTYRNRVVAAHMSVSAPPLTIAPETLGDKLWDAVGGEDIDTESDEFSKAFWVKCGDRRFAYAVLDPGMQEFLLASGPQSWQWTGPVLLWHDSGELALGDLPGCVALVVAFVRKVPRVVASLVAAT